MGHAADGQVSDGGRAGALQVYDDGVLGIDVGAGGGLAWVQGERLVAALRMPTLQVAGRKVIDTMAIDDWLSKAARERMSGALPGSAVIEQVSAMPKQGIASAFTFGRYAGALEAYAMINIGRVHYVTASVWKRRARIPKGANKRASLDLAKLIFGGANDARVDWSVLANDGVAEAALIATYGVEG